MSDTFLYSEATEDGYTNEVTPEDLNNIAIDLGIPDYSRFPEEPPQSAVAALNGITKDLTTKGVLQIGSKCEVSIADGVVTVADGVIVFDSGAKKRLETAVTLNFIEGAVNYVYAFNNVSGNQIQLICGHDAPVDGTDYVMLAEVSESQKVSDRRYWSISKNTSGTNVVAEITVWLHPYVETIPIVDVPIPTRGATWVMIWNSSDERYRAALLVEGEKVILYRSKYQAVYFTKTNGVIQVSGNSNTCGSNVTFYLA